MKNILNLGIAQISPIWLNREKTIEKICDYISRAASEKCDLVVFGEAILPGYPFWVELTDGAKFNSKIQKEIFAYYFDEAIQIERDDLEPICKIAAQKKIAVMLGIIERPSDRGGHSLYCSLIFIDNAGIIKSVHRKVIPTYEERLVWSPGDGNGLVTNRIKEFTVGGLNCWENWLPLIRSSLYAQGEDLHVAVWPGSQRNTHEITRFIAQEARSFVLSVSGVLTKADISTHIPHHDIIISNAPETLANGGSCLSGPDGSWIVEPFTNEEKLVLAEINHNRIREERQNLDNSGHYSRPDITKLSINRERQSILEK